MCEVQFNKKQEGTGTADTDGLSVKRKIAAEREKKHTQNDFAYTMFAATRSRQRQLINFIRMADLMLASALRTLLMASCRQVVDMLDTRVNAMIPAMSVGAVQQHSSDGLCGASSLSASQSDPVSFSMCVHAMFVRTNVHTISCVVTACMLCMLPTLCGVCTLRAMHARSTCPVSPLIECAMFRSRHRWSRQ